MTTQVLYRSAGASEDTWPITIGFSEDISGAQVSISLGTLENPGQWLTPTNVDFPSNNTVEIDTWLNEDVSLGPGEYWVWIKLVAGGRIVIRMLDYLLRVF